MLCWLACLVMAPLRVNRAPRMQKLQEAALAGQWLGLLAALELAQHSVAL